MSRPTASRARPRVPNLHQDRWGNWHWKPGPSLRPFWKTVALGKEREPAEREARRINRDVEIWRVSGAAAKARASARAPRVRLGPKTVGQVIELYKASTSWRRLRERTQAHYVYLLKRLADEFGHEVAVGLGRPRVSEWAEALAFEAPSTARHLVACGRSVLNWAIGKGHVVRSDNPFDRLGMSAGRRRSFRFLWPDVLHILAVAEDEGVASIGVALAVGFATVGRITDVLEFHDGLLTVPAGRPRLVYEQSKRKKVGKGGRLEAMVTIDMLRPEVVAEILRRHPPRLVHRRGERSAQARHYWIVSEETGRPYNEKTAARVFARLLKLAIARDPKRWAHLAGGQLRDGRRSGFVHRIVAGATIPQVCTISGHSLKEGHDIVEHYLPRTAELADQADAYLTVTL